MIEYNDIENKVLEIGNMGGAWENVYAAPKADFAEFASRPPEDGNRSASTMNKLIIGQDKLKPGKRLITMYNTLEKVSLKGTKQGGFDGISHKIDLALFNPGLTAEGLAILLTPNQNWIFYVRTGNQMFRVGGPQFAAKMAPEGEVGTGEATGDLKGNGMVFTTYDVGFAPEVVDIDAILAMTKAVDENLTVVFAPAHGAVGAPLATDPTIVFAIPVINADTMQAFTSQQIESIISFKQLDVDGNEVADKPFTAAIVGETVTITPNTDLAANTIYEIRFDASKVLSAAGQGRVNGSNYIRFTSGSA